ncbi:MAG: DUF5694 domain-containing protein [Bacteroidota bacterium]
MLRNTTLLLIVISLFLSCQPQQQNAPEAETDTFAKQKEILLVGSFHFNNPGADVAKTKSFDILNAGTQAELADMAAKIKAFQPTKIFVEWPYDEQEELDSLYHLYTAGTYFEREGMSDFYRKNEIFQLAFRTAKEIGLKGVHAVDYNETDFPFDSVMTVMQQSGQTDLLQKVDQVIQTFTAGFDEKIESGASLKEMLYHLNQPGMRQMDVGFQIESMLLVGDTDNFIGPYLAAEWTKRNLYMWSLIKKMSREDEKVMVLLGASHVAVIQEFIQRNPDWRGVELQEILE